MEPVLACLVGQLGKRDEFLLCLHEKISSHFAGTILLLLTVVKNSLRQHF